MAKQSQLDKAIESLMDEIAILGVAVQRLEAQRTQKPVKVRKPVAARESAQTKTGLSAEH